MPPLEGRASGKPEIREDLNSLFTQVMPLLKVPGHGTKLSVRNFLCFSVVLCWLLCKSMGILQAHNIHSSPQWHVDLCSDNNEIATWSWWSTISQLLDTRWFSSRYLHERPMIDWYKDPSHHLRLAYLAIHTRRDKAAQHVQFSSPVAWCLNTGSKWI
jgi:hypothetical protein